MNKDSSHLFGTDTPPVGHQVATPYLLILSAHCESSLQRLAAGYAQRIRAYPHHIGDICRRSRSGEHPHRRLAMIFHSTEEAIERLEIFSRGGKLSQGMTLTDVAAEQPVIGYLYAGQGMQSLGMAKEFYDRQQGFRTTLDNCDALLEPTLNVSLVDIINDHGGAFKSSRYSLPALFAVEYAVTKLLKSYGVKPDLVIGYSVGEFVAACVAGVFSLDDGLQLAAKYGELMDSCQNTSPMAEISMGRDAVEALLEANSVNVDIAAFNSGDSTIISGSAAEIEKVVITLAGLGIETKRLEFSQAFHLRAMQPVIETLRDSVRNTMFSKPKIPVLSSITGSVVGAELTAHHYWLEQITKQTCFSDDVTTMSMSGANIYIETGPSSEITELAGRTVKGDFRWLHSFHTAKSDLSNFLGILSELFVMGVDIDFRPLDG